MLRALKSGKESGRCGIYHYRLINQVFRRSLVSRSFSRFAVCSTLAVLSSAAALLSATPVSVASSKPTRIQLRSTALGKILATNAGFTLYMFTRDKKNRDACVKVPGCTSAWPVLKSSGKPVAGKGVRGSLLGTIALAPGVKQVTYAGHPLYGYVGDTSPGQTEYVGVPQFGGTWYAMNADGKLVK